MNEEITKPPLYHGTDLRILKMSKEERSVFKKGCISAIDYMWQFIKPYEEERWHTINIPTRSEPCKCFGNRLSELQPILQDENDQYLYLNVRDAILCNQCRLKNNSQYLYGYTYFTTDAAKAKRYAMRAYMFGEIGKIAYRLYQAIEKMQPEKWNPSLEIKCSIEKLVAFVAEKEEPVIIEFYDYELQYLFTDRGEAISDYNAFDAFLFDCVYYTKEVFLDPLKAIPSEKFKELNGMW